MAGNGRSLRQAVAETLMVEPALSRAEVDLHSSDMDRHNGGLRERIEELLEDAPPRPAYDGFLGQDLNPGLINSLRVALGESLNSNSTLAQSEMTVLQDLGLEKLGEFRTAIRGHLSSEAELSDRDLAIYVKAGDGRKTAFQRALEENLKELGERPPFERKVAATPDRSPVAARGEPAEFVEPANEVDAHPEEPRDGEPGTRTVTLQPVRTGHREERTTSVSPGTDSPGVPRMEPIPLLTTALAAVGVAEDEFGFVLRYGRYAQPGRSSEFLVGGVGLSDLSDRLTGWLEAQGADDCEVQVLDDGSGELMIYLLGHDDPIPSPGTGPLAGQG